MKSRDNFLAGGVPVAQRLREIIRQTCSEMGVGIEKGVLSSDHVHMFVSMPPHLALSTVMQRIKGRSRKLGKKVEMSFAHLKRTWPMRRK